MQDQYELGTNLITLGKLLKKPNAKLKDIVKAAHACGFMYTFELLPMEDTSESSDSQEA